MTRILRLILGLVPCVLRSRQDLLHEILALRQQLTVLKAKRPEPKLQVADRAFWILLKRFWSGWKQALIRVQPETMVRWHRAGFKTYWSWLMESLTALIDGLYLARQGKYPALQTVCPGGKWTESFWIRASGI